MRFMVQVPAQVAQWASVLFRFKLPSVPFRGTLKSPFCILYTFLYIVFLGVSSCLPLYSDCPLLFSYIQKGYGFLYINRVPVT